MTENVVPVVAPKIRINWLYTIIFGMWGASWSVIDGVYHNYLPVFYQAGNPNYNVLGASAAVGFGLGAFITGLIIAGYNVANAVIQPFSAAFSDRAKSRKVFVVIFGTLTAIFAALLPVGLALIPKQSSGNLSALVIPFVMMVTFGLLMMICWGIASPASNGLMYSIVPSSARTMVSSYVAFLGGIAFVVMFLTSNMLYSINPGLPFWLGAGLLLFTVLAYAFLVKEPKDITLTDEDLEQKGGLNLLPRILSLFSAEQKRAIGFVIATKFMAWFGVAGLQTYASSYVINVLGMNEATAGNLMALYFVGYLFFVIPAGLISAKIGRKRLLLFGLIATSIAGLVQYLLNSPTLLYFVLIIGGAANAVVDVMCVPMVTDIAPSKKVMGVTVSILTSTAVLASILAVPLWGAIIQALGNNYAIPWLGMAISPAVGILFLLQLKGKVGEVKPDAQVENW